MQNLKVISILFVLFTIVQTNVMAAKSLHCRFKDSKVEGVQTIKLENDSVFINEDTEIPLDKTIVRCGNFGRQTRLDGSGAGYMVILKSCTTEAKLEGSLIDSIKVKAADILCDVAL